MMEFLKRQDLDKVTMIEITDYCNLSCFFCSKHCYNSESLVKEISKEEILFQIRESPTSIICLSGGEPTLNKHLKEYLQEIKKNNKKALIVTNGLKFSDDTFCKEILPLLDYLIWTIVSLKESSYNKITCTNNYYFFEKAYSNLVKWTTYFNLGIQVNRVLLKSTIPEISIIHNKLLQDFSTLDTIEYIYPFMDKSDNYLNELPLYEDIIQELKSVSNKRGVTVSCLNTPFCKIKNFISSLEIKTMFYPLINTLFYRYIDNQWYCISSKDIQIQNNNTYYSECLHCKYKDFCFGYPIYYPYRELMTTKGTPLYVKSSILIETLIKSIYLMWSQRFYNGEPIIYISEYKRNSYCFRKKGISVNPFLERIIYRTLGCWVFPVGNSFYTKRSKFLKLIPIPIKKGDIGILLFFPRKEGAYNQNLKDFESSFIQWFSRFLKEGYSLRGENNTCRIYLNDKRISSGFKLSFKDGQFFLYITLSLNTHKSKHFQESLLQGLTLSKEDLVKELSDFLTYFKESYINY